MSELTPLTIPHEPMLRTGKCTTEGCPRHGTTMVVRAVLYDQVGRPLAPGADPGSAATFAFPAVQCLGCACEPLWDWSTSPLPSSAIVAHGEEEAERGDPPT